jgi:hypothetical protein
MQLKGESTGGSAGVTYTFLKSAKKEVLTGQMLGMSTKNQSDSVKLMTGLPVAGILG